MSERKLETIKEYEDILFDYYNGIARITINRERYRNAFTPTTTGEMSDAMRICREKACISVVAVSYTHLWKKRQGQKQGQRPEAKKGNMQRGNNNVKSQK